MKTRISLKIENHFFAFIHALMAVLFLLLSAFLISLNRERQFSILIGCIIYLLLSSLRHYNLAHNKNKILQWILPYLEGIVILLIGNFDMTTTILSLYVLVIMDIAIDYEYGYGLVFAFLGYIAYMEKYIQIFAFSPLGTKILIFLIGGVQIVLYVGFAFLAKKYNTQSNTLQKTTAELHSKMIAMEQMTVLKERNRIAGEIHNTVGHQLTTALVQIEATQLLMEKDPQEAQRRLGVIKTQVREGLQEIRKSIDAINAEHEYKNIEEAVEKLLDQVRTHSKIHVDFETEEMEEAKLQMKKALYHMILESITNAIRHGHCERMKIKISKDQGRVLLTSFNDGVVPKDFKYGYGLTHIRETCKEWGGSFSTKINRDGWFGLVIELPLYHQKGEGNE